MRRFKQAFNASKNRNDAMGDDDQRLRDLAWSSLWTAPQPQATTRSYLRPIPEIGAILRVVRR